MTFVNEENAAMDAMPMATSENPQGRLYHFPHLLFTKRNPMETHEQHLKKLAEESCEVAMANEADDVISEAWDVIHCAEEILREYPDADVRRVLADHDAKNRRRGYYGDAAGEAASIR